MKRLIFLLPLVLWCCSKSAKTEPPAVTAEPAPPPSASAPAPSATPAARALQPPEGSPSREEREKAALALLSGEKSAATLPLAATDPGEAFDPQRRKAMQSGQKGTLKIDPATGEGIPTEAIQKTMQAVRRAALRCYRSGLALNPVLQGRIQARITLSSAGKPPRVENAGSDIPDAGVVGCVLRALEEGDFPAAEGKIAAVTMRFQPDP